MAKKREYHIPDHILIPACDQTRVDFPDHCCDKWGEKEAAHCRDLCGEEYAWVETDWIRDRSKTLRKAGKLQSVRAEMVRKAWEPPSGEYAKYLESDHWQTFRIQVLEFWDYRCCLDETHNEHLEVHHRTYQRIGQERLQDCVVLCRSCHRKVHNRLPNGNESFHDNLPLFGEVSND